MLTKTGRKAYQYDMAAVEGKLVTALKRRREATIADLVTDTALPKIQVEEGMRLILHEYVGHLKATQSGELLYSFPTGMRNQVKGFGPALRRAMRAFWRGAARVLSFLFKIWIAVMLVGYFVLFVALFVLALVASVAGSMASKGEGNRDSRSRGSGIGGFYFVSRVIDLIFIRLLLNSGAKKDKGEKGRPLHRSIFAFVFGEKDSEQEWEERERKAVLRFARSHKGVVSLEEIVRLTGRSREEAERFVTELLVEYEGEPIVTEQGTILYSFGELLRTKVEVLSGERAAATLRSRPLVPFSDNKRKTNRWIAFFNAFNLVFGSYFLGFPAVVAGGSASMGAVGAFYAFVYSLVARFLGVNPLPLLGIGLGIVPVAFSIIFYVIPAVRKWRLERRNEEIRLRNLRRDVYGSVMARPLEAVPEELAREALERGRSGAETLRLPGGQAREVARAQRALPRKVNDVVRREVEALAAAKQAAVEQLPGGSFRYNLSELAREIEDTRRYRETVDTSKFDVGETVFDSAE